MLTQKDFLFDKRLTNRLISRGVISRKEYETHIAKLPDVTDKSVPMAPPDDGEQDSQADATAEQ